MSYVTYIYKTDNHIQITDISSAGENKSDKANLKQVNTYNVNTQSK